MRVIIAAAGTGGHINPGIAIANKIKEEEPDSKIIFIGTDRGLENDLVPRSGYELKTINAYGLSKKISINNFKNIIKTLKGYGEAKKIIKEFNPDIVIGTGGYICGATITAAHKLHIPTILHESNAFPGKAIKMLAKKTNCILVSFEDAICRIKNANKIVYTGTPTKLKKINYTQQQVNEMKNRIGLDKNIPVILVFGGSQGAQSINETIIGIAKKNLNDNYQIMWATGPKQYDLIKEKFENENLNINYIKNMKIVPYIYNMEEIMNISDIIVARSGAMSVTEISNLGKPSILIPLPNVSNDHQLYNAKVLEKIKAAKIILNKDLTDNVLNYEIKNIINDPQKMKEMGISAQKIEVKDVETKIYSEIKSLVEKNTK
ncbi:MAG: undecaprenyldiphospho-muramoylpentapeptide beta-N-acetylglucosaminyltransferase [Clostridiaceae bacterium]|nr:undecaprenyldiphospho-muramoylpentapeptide beta-N-acetylglucosaminyltransferase [Clostridiaceae bacterium]